MVDYYAHTFLTCDYAVLFLFEQPCLSVNYIFQTLFFNSTSSVYKFIASETELKKYALLS